MSVPTFRLELIQRLVSVVVLLVIWEVAARSIDSRLFPSLLAVVAALGAELRSGALLHHLGVTLGRVTIAFVLAMVFGSLIGIAMGRLRRLDILLDGWIMLLLNIPALITIMLAYVWLGLIESAAIAAVVINKFPVIVVTMREGARTLDRDYLEMARAFRVDRWQIFRYVTLPQLVPFFLAAARTGLSIVWKIVLVVELLGRSDGIGFQISIFFQLFDVTRLIGYAIAFILVVQALEWGVLMPIERRATRWRR